MILKLTQARGPQADSVVLLYVYFSKPPYFWHNLKERHILVSDVKLVPSFYPNSWFSMDVKSLAVAPVSSDQLELEKLCLIRTAFFAGYDYLMVAEGIYVQRRLSADRRLGMLVLEFVDVTKSLLPKSSLPSTHLRSDMWKSLPFTDVLLH